MRIESEVKLDYKDVLLRPKRSTLTSRKEVNLEREFKFRNSKQSYCGIPIMAANMDGVGTFQMANTLAVKSLFTCLKKTYSVKDINNYYLFNPVVNIFNHTSISIGITEEDKAKLTHVYENNSLKFVCIDVANGYTERFIDFIKWTRDNFPYLTIIAGNVVTGDITEELILSGADIVKVVVS